MSETEIKSGRLTLRPVSPRDAGPITEAVNDPRVHRMISSIAPGQSKAETLAWIATHDRVRAEDIGYRFAICTAEGDLCGIIGADRAMSADPFNIGYWLKPAAWGMGYATEAGAALIGWLEAARGARALVAGYFTDNPASGRVLQKLGFLPCGRSPMFSKGRGEAADHIMVARIA